MAEYVVGFAYSGKKLLLIKKQRPAFQLGKLNGVGGKIEKDETPKQAMYREFKEETGIEIKHSWKEFCVLSIPMEQSHYSEDTIVHFFYAESDRIWHAAQMTDEELHLVDLLSLPNECMDNVKWLVPMFINDKYHYSVTENQKI